MRPRKSRYRAPKTRGEVISHFLVRMRQRVGIDLSRRDYLAMNQAVTMHNYPLLFKESGSRTHWLVYINNQWVSVVYNNKLGLLTTVLDEDQTRHNLSMYGETLEDYTQNYAVYDYTKDDSLMKLIDKRYFKTVDTQQQQPEEAVTPVVDNYMSDFLPEWLKPLCKQQET